MPRRLNPVWLVVAAAVLLAAVAAYYLLSPRPRCVVTTALEPTPTGSVNILLIGKDARALGPVVNEGRQRNPREAQSHSDIVIVCHVNFEVPSLSFVAIPRDLLVEVPGHTAAASNTDFSRMEKLAHTYAIGGDSLLRRVVANLLGIPIHRSIAFDFDTFRMAFDVLRPFVGRLRVGDASLTEREQALQFARKRRGLEFDDVDRCRNAVSFVRSVVARTWWLGGTRLGNIVAGRLLAIVGEDTDLTLDEAHQLADGLRRAGFSPVRTETAVMVGEGADVTLTRYGMTLSCYLPVYGEIERQVERFLLDKSDVPALDFMTQQKFRAPGYLFEDYATPVDSLPFDTAGMDSQLKATRLKELSKIRGDDQDRLNTPGLLPGPPAETAAADSVRKD